MSDTSDSDDQPQPEVYRSPPRGSAWHEGERDRVSVVQLANVLLRHRWKVVGTSLLVAVVLVAATVLWPASYTSEASLMPESGSGSGAMPGQFAQLSGVASQFGLNLFSGGAGQSPEFYADLLTSRRLLEEAVTTRYRRGSVADNRGDGEEGQMLVELYEVEAPSEAVAVSVAADQLRDDLSVTTESEIGLVELAVTTPWPSVSKQIADRLIELVNRFNNRVRQTQASAQAEFVADRLDEARDELRAAEDSLENFLQRNVSWQQSPELRFRHDRLQRRVNLKQQVYSSLASRYEEARISEVKNTPVVTAVTRPELPVRPDSGRLPLKAAVGLVLGGVVGVLWAFGSEFRKSLREEDADDYRMFVSLKEDAADDVRRVGRTLRRLLGGDSSPEES